MRVESPTATVYANSDIGALLRELTARLEAVSESPRLDAELLLARAIDMPRSYLFAHPEDTLDPAAIERLDRNLNKRLDGEPMAYITGTREFWSMALAVNPATLVPRPETEILIELALQRIPRKAEWQLLDLGTGSGAIALALARERPLCRITATDISAGALAVAAENARTHQLPAIEFLQGDWVQPVAGRQFDLIVSNPPYVADKDPSLLTLRSEPQLALHAGPDGLDAIRVLARDCGELLADGGWFLCEHGATQADAAADVLAHHGWHSIECHNDHAGFPRVTAAKNGP